LDNNGMEEAGERERNCCYMKVKTNFQFIHSPANCQQCLYALQDSSFFFSLFNFLLHSLVQVNHKSLANLEQTLLFSSPYSVLVFFLRHFRHESSHLVDTENHVLNQNLLASLFTFALISQQNLANTS